MDKRNRDVANYDLDPRRHARIELSVSGELITSGGSKPCIVEDISLSGARVSGAVPLSPGESGILKCRELDILTEVRWRSDQDLGLSFAEALDPNGDCGEDVEAGDDEHRIEAAQRQANNRRFLRLFWNIA